jgi:hypothetical protein
VAGVSRVSLRYRRSIGLVKAPDREGALLKALDAYGPLYTDIEIRGEPLAHFPIV